MRAKCPKMQDLPVSPSLVRNSTSKQPPFYHLTQSTVRQPISSSSAKSNQMTFKLKSMSSRCKAGRESLGSNASLRWVASPLIPKLRNNKGS